MKCPKCEKEMEPGFIMVEGYASNAKWYGKDEERLILGGDLIYRGKMWDMDWIESLRCRNCNAFTLFLPRLKAKTGKEKVKTRPPI